MRTTHKHGVEPTLGAGERAKVRRRFADSKVRLLSLGTACEFHSPDTAVVEKLQDTTNPLLLMKYFRGLWSESTRYFPRLGIAG
ncbi:MAG: hypothetical protein ABMA13_14700 [Chthoniobacteraceae bacterium]